MNPTDLSKLKVPASNKNEIFSKLIDTTAENTVSEEYSLPDYIPDVKRILQTNARTNLNSYSHEGNKINFEGYVIFIVLLLTEDDAIKSISVSYPYEGFVESNSDLNNTDISIMPKLDNVVCKLQNPRKLLLGSKVNTYVNATNQKDITPSIEGIKSAADELALERDIRRMNTLLVTTSLLDDQSMSEDIVIDSQMPPASSILYCGIDICISDFKPQTAILQLSGNAAVTVIYADENGNPHTIVKRVPVSAAAAMAGSGEYIAPAQVNDIKTQIAADSYGENRIIELDATYRIIPRCMSNKEVSYTADMYSTSSALKNINADIDSYILRKCINTNFTVNAKKALSETGTDNIENIINTSVILKNNGLSYDSDKKRTILNGSALINILANCSDGYKNISYTEPFKYEIDLQSELNQLEFMDTLNASNVKSRADSGNIYTDFEVILGLALIEKNKINSIINTTLTEQPQQSKSRPPMTLYYPSKGERLWDIAKYYGTTRDAIMSANNMANDTITDEKVLLIPKVRKQPVFEKVI